jgi:hypothetical protein
MRIYCPRSPLLAGLQLPSSIFPPLTILLGHAPQITRGRNLRSTFFEPNKRQVQPISQTKNTQLAFCFSPTPPKQATMTSKRIERPETTPEWLTSLVEWQESYEADLDEAVNSVFKPYMYDLETVIEDRPTLTRIREKFKVFIPKLEYAHRYAGHLKPGVDQSTQERLGERIEALASTIILVRAAAIHNGVKKVRRTGPSFRELQWEPELDLWVGKLKWELDDYEKDMVEIELRHKAALTRVGAGEGTLEVDRDCLRKMERLVSKVQVLQEKVEERQQTSEQRCAQRELTDATLGCFREKVKALRSKRTPEGIRVQLKRSQRFRS